MQTSGSKNNGPGGDAPAEHLVTKAEVAKAMRVSKRTIDNWIHRKLIPVISLSPRCKRFHMPSCIAAALRFTVKEAQ